MDSYASQILAGLPFAEFTAVIVAIGLAIVTLSFVRAVLRHAAQAAHGRADGEQQRQELDDDELETAGGPSVRRNQEHDHDDDCR